MSSNPEHRELSGTQFHHAPTLEAHAEKALLQPNPHLVHAIKNSISHSLPPITVTPLAGQHLALICKLMHARTVLELGTLGGYSTIWFASAGAHVTSVEIDPRHRDVALGNTKGLENVEIVLGAALDVLARFRDEGRKFDFVFVDASWGEQWECFQGAVDVTRKGGCVYVDNVVREMLETGAFEEGRESLLTRVGKDPRVEATLVPTVQGNKEEEGRFDGFLLAVVKE